MIGINEGRIKPKSGQTGQRAAVKLIMTIVK
jgi:hypothetical protein